MIVLTEQLGLAPPAARPQLAPLSAPLLAELTSRNYAALSTLLPADEHFRAVVDSDATFAEPCPACEAAVTLELPYSTCPSGHVWSRCSVTLRLLDTSQTRTCCACGRKALLTAPDAQLKALIDACVCCLFCGNRWVEG